MDLREATERREQIAKILADEVRAIKMFKRQDRAVISLFPQRGISDEDGDDVSADMTTTAFTLYMFLGLQRGIQEARSTTIPYLEELEIDALRTSLETGVKRAYTVTPSCPDNECGFLRSDGAIVQSGGSTTSAKLPNYYNTPIHLAGLLVADRYRESKSIRDKADLLPTIAALAWRSAKGLKSVVEHSSPVFERVPNQKTDLTSQIPGVPYLWYWNYIVVLEFQKLLQRLGPGDGCLAAGVETAVEELHETATLFRSHATNTVAYITAAHHSEVGGQFDASDYLFSLAISALRSPEEHRGGSEKIVEHGLSVLLERNIAPEGSVIPRTPAFVDLQRRPITISTPEHAALMLEALGPKCQVDTEGLEKLFNYIVRRRHGYRGWGALPESEGSAPGRTVFVTASAIAFLLRYEALLQNDIESTALRQLAAPVEDFKEDKTHKLDRELEALVDREIVSPLRGGRRELATMSLVLNGPPGTSKTTAARRISAKLGWPLITLDPGVFLRSGFAGVEAEAERVFKLLLHLQNKVVLFDEFEEMIVDRSSTKGEKHERFLTTSMLPRLHKVRDRGEIVFVIATNHLDTADPAAYRFGRVDRVVQVTFPTPEVRAEMFEAVCAKTGLSAQVKSILQDLGFPKSWVAPEQLDRSGALAGALSQATNINLEEFAHGEIFEVGRRLALLEATEPPQAITEDAVANVLTDVASHSSPSPRSSGQ